MAEDNETTAAGIEIEEELDTGRFEDENRTISMVYM
jgi:hypothetical protein